MLSVRAAAAQVIAQILQAKGSLSSLLPAISAKIPDNDRALLQELCFGTCRFYPQLQAYTECLLDKPLRAKDSDVQALLLLGLYQLLHTRIPDHAAIGGDREEVQQAAQRDDSDDSLHLHDDSFRLNFPAGCPTDARRRSRRVRR